MKRFTTLAAALGIGLFTIGCSQEAQLERAQENYLDERQETADAIYDAQEGGVVTDEDRQDIAEEQAEDTQAAGDVIREEGELREERIDN